MKIKRWLKRYKIGTLIIDLSFALFFLFCFIYERNGGGLNLIPFEIRIDESIGFLASLIPLIIMVITFSVESLNNKKDYFGSTRTEFESLRSTWVYSLFHMVLVTIGLFLLYLISYSFDANYTILVLDLISIAFAIIFAIQELPITLHNERILRRILASACNAFTVDKVLPDTQEYKSITTIIRSLVIEHGLVVSYALIKGRKKNNDPRLLEILLEEQNKFLFSFLDSIKLYENDKNGMYKGIEISSIIENATKNIFDLFDFNQEVNISILNVNSVYLPCRTTFVLQKLCFELGLEKRFNDEIESALSTLCLSSYGKNKKTTINGQAFIFVMTFNTIAKGEEWFFNSFPSYLFYPSLSENSFATPVFIVMLMAYLCSCKGISSGNKETIKKIYNAKWHQSFSIQVLNLHYDYSLRTILSFFEFYDSLKDGFFYYTDSEGDGLKDLIYFSPDVVVDYWIELLVYGYHFDVDIGTTKTYLYSLPERIQNIIYHRLKYFWFSDGQFVNNKDKNFLSFADEDFSYCANQTVIKDLSLFREEKEKEHIEKQLSDSGEEENAYLTEILRKESASIISKLPFIDNNLPLSEQNKKYFSIVVEGDSKEELLKSFTKQLKNGFESLIRNDIETRATIYLVGDINESVASDIIDFNPDYSRDNVLSIYLNNQELAKKINAIPKIEGSTVLPRFTYFKKDAIRINVNLDVDMTVVRSLTDEEIERFIDDKYSSMNGLYRFSMYPNDSYGSIFVNREELHNLISKNVCFAVIVFEYDINVVGEDVIIIHLKKQ